MRRERSGLEEWRGGSGAEGGGGGIRKDVGRWGGGEASEEEKHARSMNHDFHGKSVLVIGVEDDLFEDGLNK